MASTQIADIYEALLFEPVVAEMAIEKNRFLNSGILVQSPLYDALANSQGSIVDLPFNKSLTVTEPNYSSDDPAANSTPAKLTTGKQIGRNAYLNYSWSTMDLIHELATPDPLLNMGNRIGKWWATAIEKRLIQSFMGVLADNVANDNEDMVNNIATDSADPITAAELISPNAIIGAAITAGDAQEMLDTIIMHSVVFAELQTQNQIDYIRASDNNMMFDTIMGRNLIIDDSLPAVAGTNRTTYTTILCGSGAAGYGVGTPKVPSETDREPSAGNGGGEETIYSRRTDLIHPLGFQFTSASVAGESATLAELATAANWDRVMERKNINVAFLQTNG